jgi:hypothetical protein
MESKALALDTPFFWNPNKFYVFFFGGSKIYKVQSFSFGHAFALSIK